MFVPLAQRTRRQVKATTCQERLIRELALADTVVLSVLMYNLGILSAPKTWIDHIVVFGRTVDMGLFDGTVVIITARGAHMTLAHHAQGTTFRSRIWARSSAWWG
jgi:FMN-dependent NADH-azoreductase